MPELGPCRYCGAPTILKRAGYKSYQILNEDGSPHSCHEAERAKAIPTIFGTEVDNTCYPLSPEQTLEELREIYNYYSSTCLGEDEAKGTYALGAAIEVLKLVTR